MKIKLQRVLFMPKVLEPGVLYVADEFGAAAHLCACGCGTKIRTPLGPTGWSLEQTENGPTLNPSIGNWQHPCQSHYWIEEGEIRWAKKWTRKQIAAGYRREETRRRAYYDSRDRKTGPTRKLWHRMKRMFKR